MVLGLPAKLSVFIALLRIVSEHELQAQGTQCVDISFLHAVDTLLLLVDLRCVVVIGANEALAQCVWADGAELLQSSPFCVEVLIKGHVVEADLP